MTGSGGDAGRFRLRGWGEGSAPLEQTSDDFESLKTLAGRLCDGGGYRRIEVDAWNIELNDWVRMATFPAA